MQAYDIILLTTSKYLATSTDDPLFQNILLEDKLLGDAFEELELTHCRKAWDDPNFNWSSAQCVFIRTPWDYFDRYDEFSNWFQETTKVTQFINTGSLVEWNIDKHYLLDLKNSGVHIPKTLFIEPKTKTTLLESIEEAKSSKGFQGEVFIIKPCIAGGAWHTYKFHLADWKNYENVFQKLISKETMMLQEFQKNIVMQGEVSMMVFDGSFSHAVLKKAKRGDFRVQDDFGGSVQAYQPTKNEIDFAEAVVKACPELPLYARVDIFNDNEGRLALAELEIFEPELWFRLQPEAAQMMAKCISENYFQ